MKTREPGRDSSPQLHEVQKAVVHSPCLLPAGSNIAGFGAPLHSTCLEGSQRVVCLPQRNPQCIAVRPYEQDIPCGFEKLRVDTPPIVKRCVPLSPTPRNLSFLNGLQLTYASAQFPCSHSTRPSCCGMIMVLDNLRLGRDMKECILTLEARFLLSTEAVWLAFLHFCPQFMIWANVWTSATLFSCSRRVPLHKPLERIPKISSSLKVLTVLALLGLSFFCKAPGKQVPYKESYYSLNLDNKDNHMGPYMIMLYPQMEAPSKLVALINGVVNGVAVSSSLVSPRQIHLAKAAGDSLLEHHIPQAYLPLPSQRAEIGWDQGENFHESLINKYGFTLSICLWASWLYIPYPLLLTSKFVDSVSNAF